MILIFNVYSGFWLRRLLELERNFLLFSLLLFAICVCRFDLLSVPLSIVSSIFSSLSVTLTFHSLLHLRIHSSFQNFIPYFISLIYCHPSRLFPFPKFHQVLLLFFPLIFLPFLHIFHLHHPDMINVIFVFLFVFPFFPLRQLETKGG